MGPRHRVWAPTPASLETGGQGDVARYWYFSQQSWFQLVLHPAWYFAWCIWHVSQISRPTIYSLNVYSFPSFEPVSCCMPSSNCYFLTHKFFRRQVRWSGTPISVLRPFLGWWNWGNNTDILLRLSELAPHNLILFSVCSVTSVSFFSSVTLLESDFLCILST